MPTAAELLEQLETEFPNTVQQRVRQYNLKDAYKTVAWVYSCCNLIADSISGVEFYFSRKDTNGGKIRLESLDEPVVYCFYPPRTGEIPTLAEMIKMQFLHLGLFGETFLLMEMKGGQPTMIDIINPLNISPVISKDGRRIEKWKVRQVQPGGQAIDKLYPIDQIIQWKYPNPYNKFRGMAPLTAARLAIEQDLNMATWNAGFFQNGLRNPIALMLKQTFNDPQRKEYMSRMKQNFTGFVKGQLPLLVEGGVDVRVLSNTMKDLDFVQGKELTREELCAVYNVPPAMAGIFRYANYSNTKEQRTMLYQNTLRPKMVYFRDIFQQSILDQFFPGVVADWEWNSIDAFKEDPAVEAQVRLTDTNTARTLWDMGYTQSQIAYILRRPEFDPVTHVTAEPIEPELPEPEVPKLAPPQFSHSKDHLVLYASKKWMKHVAVETLAETLRPNTQRMSSFISAFMDKMGKTLRRSAKVNVDFWTSQWTAGVAPTLKATYMAGVESAYRDLKISVPDGGPPASMLEGLDLKLQSAGELGKSLISVIAKRCAAAATTSERVDVLVRTIPELTEGIVTEAIIHRIYNLGRFEALKTLGVLETAWCYGGGCEDGTHKTLHAVSVAVGETFPTTDLAYPGERGNTVCNCTVFPLTVKKPEKKVKLTKGA